MTAVSQPCRACRACREAIERTLYLSGTPDPPSTHVEASSPSEGYTNANPDGNKANLKYWCAIPGTGHTSLTDGGAVPWSSKRQDTANHTAPSLTSESDCTSQRRPAAMRCRGFAARPQTFPDNPCDRKEIQLTLNVQLQLYRFRLYHYATTWPTWDYNTSD